MTELVDMLPVQMELGECPLWDHRTDRLYWVDIIKCTLFERDWASGGLKTWPLPALGGGLALLGGSDLMVATQTGLFRFSPVSGEYSLLIHPEPGLATNRLNEGKVDAEGNFWIGSICTLGRRPQGSLYRVAKTKTVTQILGGIHVPNALVFLDDNEALFTDSHLKLIWRFRLDPRTGTFSDRRVFVDDTAFASIPDGAARAKDGSIWNAKFGGAQVVAYDDKGSQIADIQLPVTQVTSCTFAGPQLDHLVVTTAKRRLDETAREAQPDAGNLFIFRPGLQGLAEPICNIE